MPPSTSATRRTTAASRSVTRSKSKAGSIAADDLAAQLASNFNISGEKRKQSLEECRLSAMRSVNLASQSLSTTIQAGWNLSSEVPPSKKSSNLTSVNSAANMAAKSLKELRRMCPGDVDVERAASSVLGKLISLEMFDTALSALAETHSGLCSLYAVPPPAQALKKPTLPDQLYLLSLPLPQADSSMDQTTLTIISTYLLHTITIFSRFFLTTSVPIWSSPKGTGELDSFSDILCTTSTLLAWVPALSTLPAKHTDSMLTRAYTILTKSCLTCHMSPQAVFSVRAYALSCLLYTTLGTVEPNTFWDQAIKFGRAFIKSTTSLSEGVATTRVLSTFSGLVARAEKLPVRNIFLKGKGFLEFCEYWMAFAKRVGDISALDTIASLMQEGSEQGALDPAVLCAALTQMTALLEKSSGDYTDDLVKRAQEATAALTRTRDEDLQRMGGKIERGLERMRRAAVKVIDGTSAGNSDRVRECVQTLLGAVVDILERSSSVPSTDVLTQILDTLFALARTSLSIPDSSTYGQAYEYLIRAVRILRLEEPSNEGQIPDCTPTIDKPNYVRCVSGAFHNLAGSLYQAGRHGAAVKFLKEGCVLGVRALSMRRERGTGEGEPKSEEGWRQLEDQLYRRWELLGVCYSKIGDRKLAYEAFVESAKAFPFSGSEFVQRAGNSSLNAVFGASAGLKQLGAIVDRITHLGACELLLEPSRVSLAAANTFFDTSITGLLVERQLESLEGGKWKSGVQSVVCRLLSDALAIYGGDVMPVRRSRVLLRCLDFAYHAGPEAVAEIGSPQKMGEDVVKLLFRKELAQDVALVQFSQQYRASAHLWLALHAHRRVDEQQTALITHHTEEACKDLNSFLTSIHAGEATPKAARKSTPKQAVVTKKTTGKVPVARRVGGTARKLAHREPVTPKPNLRKASELVSLNVTTPPRPSKDLKKPVCVIDEFDKFLALLQTTASLLGLLGLVLPKIRILDITRKVCERQSGTSGDGFIMSSIDLAHEYVKLGKTKKARAVYNQVLNLVRSGQASDEACARLFLRYAESLCAIDVLQSSSLYREALSLTERFPVEDKGMSITQRIQMRVDRLERAAMASHIFAAIQYSRGDVSTSLDSMLQSLRLWNRAIDSLARLRPPQPSSKSPPESNPFEISGMRDALPVSGSEVSHTEQAVPKKAFSRRPSMEGSEWRIAEGLLTTLFALTQTYFTRGSAREAEYFAEQAQDLAESLNAPAMISRALARKGEVLLHQGQLEDAHQSLMRAAELLQDMRGTDSADIHRLRGDYNQRAALHKNAQQLYEEATNMLEELDRAFLTFDSHTSGHRKSLGLSPMSGQTQETLVPELLAAVLRQHIWLLRDHVGADFDALLNRFMSLPPTSQTKAEETALMARLTLHDVYGRFRADMFLSSLTESTISLPMGMSSDKVLSLSPSTQDIVSTLDSAERLFWEDLAHVARGGNVSYVRDAAISLTMIRALQTSLGNSGAGGSVLATSLLDSSNAITLRREMLESIQHKFPEFQAADDLQWPLIAPSGAPDPRPTNQTRSRVGFNLQDEQDIEPDLDTKLLKEYWEFIRVKYQSHTLNAQNLSSSQTLSLPANWTVVHISVTEDKSTLFVARQQGGSAQGNPLIFCVPLKGRRENGGGEEEDEYLTFQDAIDELREIVKLSDQGTRGAVHIKNEDLTARAKWWKERGELDTRMKELLENIEFCWLGAFKTILSQPPNLPIEVVTDLRTQFVKIFQRSLHLHDKKVKVTAKQQSAAQSQDRIYLDDALIECFSTLSPKCRDEELEDLIYFILDLYQFHGVPVAIAEVDVTQVVVDLRGVLEEHTLRMGAQRRDGQGARKLDADIAGDEHMFLVLDKNVQGIPWESIPILRGRSVSRIPSIDFLLDRVQLAGWKRAGGPDPGGRAIVADRAIVDPHKGYYVLNPSGDLGRTEGRFKEWLKGMEKVGWQGVIGHPPSEQQFLDALARNDLVIYFGHGGGEQYVRSHKIRNLSRCAAAMLWGCSSGALREMGDFERVGTPYNYMLAGCPTLVANIWDVTDRDIDKFSQSVFDKLRMTAHDIGPWRADSIQDGKVSLVAAVAQSRDSCKLKYLTGAAPVVYGIPFYL